MTIALMTRIAFDWGARCFGFSHMLDRRIRALRCVEEAVELAQSLGVDKQKIQRLVDVVYIRPPGDPIQELGGTLLTTCVICTTFNRTPEEIFEKELFRCLEKSPEEFAKRNRDKLNLGLN